RRIDGPNSPETLRTMDNLANALFELGRFDQAEPFFKEILDTRLRLYGANHPFTANTAYNLACMYALQNRREDALSYLSRSIDYRSPVKFALTIARYDDLKSLHGDPRFDSLAATARQRAAASKGP